MTLHTQSRPGRPDGGVARKWNGYSVEKLKRGLWLHLLVRASRGGYSSKAQEFPASGLPRPAFGPWSKPFRLRPDGRLIKSVHSKMEFIIIFFAILEF
ncbi:MAG TPA: hypothetical protein ENK41_04015 [Rhodobacteraceae bacterium]|nr:hypothetical protein [Paracoccaceae bacterium]